MIKNITKATTVNFPSALDTIVRDMFEGHSDEANQLDNKEKPDGKTIAYKCIHLSANEFIDKMCLAIDNVKRRMGYNVVMDGVKKYRRAWPKSLKFLDVGCGVGQKVYLAKSLFTNVEAFGLELRKTHVNVARNVLDGYFNHVYFKRVFNKSNIIHGNAITFNRYSEFDIIYFYCPSPDYQTEIQLEKAIAKGARVGAVVIGFLSRYFRNDESKYRDELKALGWKQIGDESKFRGCVWKRIKKENS